MQKSLDFWVVDRYDQHSFSYNPAYQQANTLGHNHISVCHCLRKVILFRLDIWLYIITFLMHMRYDQEMYTLLVASGLTHGIVIICITRFHKTPLHTLSYVRSCLSCSIPYCLLKSVEKRNHKYLVKNGKFDTNKLIWVVFLSQMARIQ